MRDADAGVEFVMCFELFDRQEQGSGVSTAGDSDDDSLVRHRELEPAPLSEQHSRKLIKPHGRIVSSNFKNFELKIRPCGLISFRECCSLKLIKPHGRI